MTQKRTLTTKLVLSILAVATLAFTDVMLETALNVNFPMLMKEFRVDTSTVQWLTSGVILLTTLVVIVSPWLKSNVANKKQFMVAGVISLIGILINAISNNFSLVLFGRLLQGVGAGVAFPLMANIIFAQVPIKIRATMLGVSSLVISFAPAIGPSLGGWLAENFGWHSIFWSMIPIQVIALIVGYFTIAQQQSLVKTKLDWLGWLSLSIMFVGGIFLIPQLFESGLANPLSILFILMVLVGLLFYIHHARRIKEPLIDIKIFNNKIFANAVPAAFLVQMISLSLNYSLPIFLGLALGQNSAQAGLLMLPAALMFAISAIIGGRLYDKFGPRWPLIISSIIILGSVTMLKIMPVTQNYLILGYVLFALGGGIFFNNMNVYAVSQLSDRKQPDGNSIFSAILNYSASLGIALAAGIVGAAQENAESLADATVIGVENVNLTNLLFAVVIIYLTYRVLKMLTNKERT